MLSVSRPTNKPIRNLTDTELLSEWHYWNEPIKAAPSWGAALAVADAFLASCETQLKIRKFTIPGE